MAVRKKNGMSGDGPERELAEARAQQTATAEILKVIASSPSDVQPVFDAIVGSVARLFGRKAALRTVEPDGLRRRARSYVPEPGEFHGPEVEPLDHTAIVGQAILQGRALQWEDTLVDGAVTYSLEKAKTLSFRSIASAPLMLKDRAIGVISVSSPTPGRLSSKQMELLSTFADQAVIAIENVRLFNETKEALERQTATAEILKVIASSPADVQPVFDAIVSSALRLLNGATSHVTRLADGQLHLAAFSRTDAAGEAALRSLYPFAVAGTAAAEFLASRQAMVVADSENDQRLPEASRAASRARGVRAFVMVPIVSNGVSIGTIVVNRREVGPFSRHEIELLQTFADQAVIAIENVRLFNETKDALERQTATAEILKVIASSPADVQPVFEAIVQSASRLFGCTTGILIRDGAQVFLKSGRGRDLSRADLAEMQKLYPIPFDPQKNITSSVIEERRIVEVTDTEAPDMPPLMTAVGRAGRFRSVALVPLQREGAGIGAISLTHPEPGWKLNDKQLSIVSTFADQAVIAIENVRLFNETREALERQTATAEILKVIASSPADVQPVLEVMATSAARLCEAKDVIVLLREGDALRYRVHRGDIGTAVPLGEAKKISRDWSAGRCAADGRQIHVHDILEDPEGFPDGARMGKQAGYRTVLMTPLLRDGVVLGVIGMRRAEVRPFEARQIELINTFADQAVIAIENVRLFNETRALQEERLSRLKSFFSPQLAELLDAGKGEELLKTHRREITVQFFDLRGFTAFTGAAEPEEVMELLREFHAALGGLVLEHEGTIERFAGDSVMVFFNDPLPVERPAERAMQSAIAMMRAFDPIAARWRKRGYDLGLGAGIAQGYATLGAIGFEGRRDYAAIGPVTNLAARLCAEAKGGQILADSKTVAALEGVFDFDALEPLRLKGFSQPMPAFALRIGEKMQP